MQLRIFVALLLLPAALALAGCPSTDKQETPPVNPPAGQPETPGAPATAEMTEPGAVAAAGAGDDVVPGLTPPDTQWQLASFNLGLTVADARSKLPTGQDVPVQEQWKVADDTGMILIGTYAEPVGRMTSVLFLDGRVVAIIDGVRQAESTYLDHFNHLRSMFGEPRGDTPEYAAGRQFIYEMQNAEPQPDHQYMWARPADESLYVTAHFTADHLTNQMLINAADYDVVAAALAAE